jgi:hypothetical protein
MAGSMTTQSNVAIHGLSRPRSMAARPASQRRRRLCQHWGRPLHESMGIVTGSRVLAKSRRNSASPFMA